MQNATEPGQSAHFKLIAIAIIAGLMALFGSTEYFAISESKPKDPLDAAGVVRATSEWIRFAPDE